MPAGALYCNHSDEAGGNVSSGDNVKLIASSLASRVKYCAGRNYTLIKDVLVRAEKEQSQ